jgi:hypothetical protein
VKLLIKVNSFLTVNVRVLKSFSYHNLGYFYVRLLNIKHIG